MSGEVTVHDFLSRFESLKKQYFNQPPPQFDEEGNEIPQHTMPKDQIVKIFDSIMNLEVPLHPGEPPIWKGKREPYMYGEWWIKKPS